MKRLLGVLLFCLIAMPAGAQETETLISGNVDYGGFGGPVVKFSSIDGDFAAFVGGRGGWIINVRPGHTFVLGGGGYGLVNEIRARRPGPADQPLYLNFGYGGVELEYVNRTHRLVHVSVQTLIGAGGINYRDRHFDNFFNDDEEAFFVAEPGASVMLNVTTFFRMGAGASYRFVSGSDLSDFGDADLSGVSGMLTFKFGGF